MRPQPGQSHDTEREAVERHERAKHLRAAPRQDPGQLRAADPAVVPEAHRPGVPGPHRDPPRQLVLQLGGGLRALPPARLRASPARHRGGGHGGGDGAQHPADVGGALRRADDGGGAERAQRPPGRGHDRLHPGPRRSRAADHRHRIRAHHQGGARAARPRRARRRHRRPAGRQRRRAAGADRVRGVPRGRRSGVRLAHARGRVGGDHPQLHLRHHRQPQRRRLPPPRRLPERGRQRAHLVDGRPAGLPLDPADVPLQRLVLPLDGRRDGGHQRVPAPGSGQADLRRDRRGGRDPPVRRADRDADAAERRGERKARPAARGQRDDRRRPAAGGRAGADGDRGLPGHPRLRPDGSLRPCRSSSGRRRRPGRASPTPHRRR